MDTSLSESSVSLQLTNIRKRCEELMKEGENELQLEGSRIQLSEEPEDVFNPYNRS